MLDEDSHRRVRWTIAMVAAAGLGASSCVLVKPNERQSLSMPEMTPTNDALEDVFHAHIDAARRGGTNGHGGGGGGCGCG